MSPISGETAEGFGAVADAFRANFDDREELGAACAVMVDGELVVDLWGGHQDKRRTRPWERDTLVTTWSTSKGMTAAAMAIAHTRGLFELDTPVAEYWPEFAAAGKAEISVRQLLSHEAGLAVIDVPLNLPTIENADKLGAILAAQSPKWEPGSTHGYHAQTLGWYESQLLRRVDPAARSVGQFFADEVADKLGVEFYLGLPANVSSDRIATFVGGSRLGAALHFREVPWPVLSRMMNPRSLTFKAFTNPKAVTKLPDINKRRMLEVELPSVNGTGTARAVASVYGDLATGGHRLGIGEATIFGLDSAFAMGFMKPFPILPFGSGPAAFGHTGSGGSFGFADPETGMGYAYVMNRNGYSLPTDLREITLRNALTSVLGR